MNQKRAKAQRRAGKTKPEPVTYKGNYWCSTCDKERDLAVTRRPLSDGMVPAWHGCPACGQKCFFRMVEIENPTAKEAA